jgi:RNA polymerase sigma-70 factor (ECF subfamily)
LSELEQLDEEELVCRAQAGCGESFGVLAERHRPGLLRMLAGRARGPLEAEDLVQESLARALENIGSYRPTGAFGAWLFTIAARLAASDGRRRREVAGPLAEPADGSAADPAAAVARDQERRNLWEAAKSTLPPAQYEALWHRYGRELPVRQVARAMRITTLHARVLLHRARRRLLSAAAFAEFDERQNGGQAGRNTT